MQISGFDCISYINAVFIRQEMYIKKKFGILGTFMCLVIVIMYFVMTLNFGSPLEYKGKSINEHCTIYNVVS